MGMCKECKNFNSCALLICLADPEKLMDDSLVDEVCNSMGGFINK